MQFTRVCFGQLTTLDLHPLFRPSLEGPDQILYLKKKLILRPVGRSRKVVKLCKSLNKNTSDTKAGEKTEKKEVFQRSLKSYKKYAQAFTSFYEKEPFTSFYVQEVFTRCNKQLHEKDYFKLYISSDTDLEHSDEAKETKFDFLSSSVEQLDLSDEKNGINLLLQKI